MSTTDELDIEKLTQEFLNRLPEIERYARHVFRRCRAADREELLAETVARAWLFFVRLSRRGKDPVQLFRPLLRFTVLGVKAGRRVGNRKNSQELCQRATRDGSRVCSLESPCGKTGDPLKLILAESRAFSPSDAAAARLDITAWLRSESSPKRAIAKLLAIGERTSVIAKQFQISAGRVSQLRGELFESWQGFQGGVLENGAVDQRYVAAAMT